MIIDEVTTSRAGQDFFYYLILWLNLKDKIVFKTNLTLLVLIQGIIYLK